MPYIDPKNRVYPGSDTLWVTDEKSAAGELNWKIANLVNGYLRVYGFDYQRLNDVIGALECNKLETYRRLAAPYENKKIDQNGDVFDSQLLFAAGAHRSR